MAQHVRLTPRRAEALKAIRNLSNDGQRTVTEAEWRAAYYAMSPASGDNKRRSFRRSVETLISCGVVREADYFEYELAKPGTKGTDQ